MSTEPTSQSQLNEKDISLKELLLVLWSNKWLILWVTTLVTVAAGTAAWVMPATYKAQVLVLPVSDTSSNKLSGLGSLASQFGGLASLAGISASSDSKKSESLAVLQSEALTEKYIRDNALLPVLFENKWDATTKKWNTADPDKIPTSWKANELFRKKVRVVSNNPKTGMATLTITWKDPKVAAKWANDLVWMTNDYLRSKAIAQSEKNIAYLNDQAAKTDAIGAKQAIYALLQNEINEVMLARGSDEYAFKVIDPAVPPEQPSSPKKLLWILGGMAAGLFFSVSLAFIRTAWK